MVTSTGYYPNDNNSAWRLIASKTSPKKTTHAEQQVWALRPDRAWPVYRFDQDGVPCEECHPIFRKLSEGGGTSFIFLVSRTGYAIHLDLSKGDKISTMHEPATGSADVKKFYAGIVKQGFLNLSADHFPVALFYFNGNVFVDIRPHGFPIYPPLPAPFG